MNTPKVTDADREAAEKYQFSRTPKTWTEQGDYFSDGDVEDAYLAGKLDERAKVDELVRALEFYRDENNWVKKDGHACSAIIADTGTRAKNALKQFSGRSG